MGKTPILSEPKILKASFRFEIVLVAPEIPPNTGNVGRLCVATQSGLHLIKPLGFSIDDKALRRAGLDYWKHVDLNVHENFEAFLEYRERKHPTTPVFPIENRYDHSVFETELPERAFLMFGNETQGLSGEILAHFPNQVLGMPMFSEHIRSLNLSNSVSIVLYEAIRQRLAVVSKLTSPSS